MNDGGGGTIVGRNEKYMITLRTLVCVGLCASLFSACQNDKRLPKPRRVFRFRHADYRNRSARFG